MPGELSLPGQVDLRAPGKPGLEFFCWVPLRFCDLIDCESCFGKDLITGKGWE